MKTETRLFIYSFYGGQYPRPNANDIIEVEMDAILDVGVRAFLMSLRRVLTRLPDGASFKKCVAAIEDTNSAFSPLYKGFTLYEKYFNAPDDKTLWVSIRGKGSDTAYGFWLSTVPISEL